MMLERRWRSDCFAVFVGGVQSTIPRPGEGFGETWVLSETNRPEDSRHGEEGGIMLSQREKEESGYCREGVVNLPVFVSRPPLCV